MRRDRPLLVRTLPRHWRGGLGNHLAFGRIGWIVDSCVWLVPAVDAASGRQGDEGDRHHTDDVGCPVRTKPHPTPATNPVTVQASASAPTRAIGA